MTAEYTFAFSRRIAPELCWKLPALQTEGAGKTGCALHPRSRVRLAQEMLHTSIQGSGEHPAFTAYAVISPETSSWLTPSLPVQLTLLRRLDACNGRQDHTVLPYA